MNYFVVALFLFLVSAQFSSAFRQQSVGVIGSLTCGGQPLPDTSVKLWDKNSLGSDTQLAQVKTDANGRFNMTGGVGSLFKMDVHFKIYHNCDNKFGLCKRKVDLKVPDEYVTRSSDVQKYFDAGTLNMQFKYPDEGRECL